MPKAHKPRQGSLQFWPRKRAKRSYTRVRSWPKLDGTKLLAFIGYKAGMTHIIAKDNTNNSITKNLTISLPVTVVECPPLNPLSLRFYKLNANNQYQIVAELFSKNLNKELKRKTKLPKKTSKQPENFDEIKLVVNTQPKLIGIKKKPDIIEVGLSGTKEQKLETGKKLLEQKEIKLEEIFKENQFLDISAVTKGKGFQGEVKRYGVTIMQHKAEKRKRGKANLGAWTPKRVSFTVPQPGKMGYHQRTEYNKQILKISDKPEEINPKAGFLHYGLIKNQYLLIKGSIPGPAKRTIVLREPIRPKGQIKNLEITKISQTSKQ